MRVLGTSLGVSAGRKRRELERKMLASLGQQSMAAWQHSLVHDMNDALETRERPEMKRSSRDSYRYRSKEKDDQGAHENHSLSEHVNLAVTQVT